MQLKKKLILDKSRRLFNEEGLSNVTIRKVALELQMSAGNLTYHFPKRKEIVKELADELSFGEAAFLEMYLSPQQTSHQLERLVYNHSKILIDYRFFWLDYLQLEREDSSIKKTIDRMMNQRRTHLDADLANYLNEFLYQMATNNYSFNNYNFGAYYRSVTSAILPESLVV